MKYCRDCGKEIDDSAFECPYCGARQQDAGVQAAQNESNIWAGLSFLGILIALLGIIFGIMGISKARKLNGKGMVLSIIGLVLSIINAILGAYLYAKNAAAAVAYVYAQIALASLL